MNYSTDTYRIGRTPKWWRNFENNVTTRIKAIGHPLPSVWNNEPVHNVNPYNYGFMKRGYSFAGLPIFGKAMKYNMESWERNYAHDNTLGKGAAFFLREEGGRTAPAYHFPADLEDQDLEILTGEHTVSAQQNTMPDPDYWFPETPRFGMHCVLQWFSMVGNWINTLECVWGVLITSPRTDAPVYGQGGYYAYTSNGLDGINTGESPMWMPSSTYVPNDPNYMMDNGGGYWKRGEEFVSGETLYASSGLPGVDTTEVAIGLSQSGQNFGGSYTQTGTYKHDRRNLIVVLHAANGFARHMVPGLTRLVVQIPGTVLAYENIAEFSKGKLIGFSYGDHDGQPGFDGWDAELSIDGKTFPVKVGDSTNEHNDVIPGFRGALFYEEITLDDTKKEWDFSLSATNMSIPDGAIGWEGGFTFMHGIFQLDIAAKLEPIF